MQTFLRLDLRQYFWTLMYLNNTNCDLLGKNGKKMVLNPNPILRLFCIITRLVTISHKTTGTILLLLLCLFSL